MGTLPIRRVTLESGGKSAGRLTEVEARPHRWERTRRLSARVVGGALAGVLFALCFPPFGFSFFLLFSLTGLFCLLRGATPREAFYIGLAFGVTLFAITLFWLTNLFGSASISLWALSGVFPALACAVTVGLARRLPRVPLWLSAGVAWTGVDLFRSEIMRPAFGWMAPGYALVGNPVASFLASLVGGYGVTFILVALAAFLARRWKGEPNKRRAGGVTVVVLWALAFSLPASRPTPDHAFKVRLVQANSEDDESLFGLSAARRDGPAALILWPEYSFVHDVTRDKKLWERLTQLPRQNRAYFLFGAKVQADRQDDTHFQNTAFLLDPYGRVIGKHVKNHPVPFIKDGEAGQEARAFPTRLGRLGIAICYDLDRPDIAQRLVADGAQVLLVPSDNPAEWGPVQHAQHRQVFQMRAAETGRWLATTDVAGNTFVVAPNGQITDMALTGEPVAGIARVGLEDRRTWFVRGGWRFGPCCLIGLVGLCLWATLPARFRQVHLDKFPA